MVALLAEGVDRNPWPTTSYSRRLVALLAEGVDRNCAHDAIVPLKDLVALLAEGVDRNRGREVALIELRRSPSSRRAWIEIR